MEDNKTTQSTVTSDVDNNEVLEGKTFTQADMDNLAGKIRAEAKSKQDEAIKIAVANAIAENERQAKLTAEEREKELKTKREKELQDRENQITLRERKIEAMELLNEKNIPKDLVDFVVDMDSKVMKNKIETLSKTYAKSVENGVTNKLKGTPPTDFSNSNAKKGTTGPVFL